MANSGRTRVTLACTECGDRNYTTTKNKKLHPERMEAMKYCPRLRRYTLHREVRGVRVQSLCAAKKLRRGSYFMLFCFPTRAVPLPGRRM